MTSARIDYKYDLCQEFNSKSKRNKLTREIAIHFDLTEHQESVVTLAKFYPSPDLVVTFDSIR